MEIEQFIEKFGEQFEDLDGEVLVAETDFKGIDEWSSLTALSIIGMVDEEYDVIINGMDIRKCESIQDIFDLVKSKK